MVSDSLSGSYRSGCCVDLSSIDEHELWRTSTALYLGGYIMTTSTTTFTTTSPYITTKTDILLPFEDIEVCRLTKLYRSKLKKFDLVIDCRCCRELDSMGFLYNADPDQLELIDVIAECPMYQCEAALEMFSHIASSSYAYEELFRRCPKYRTPKLVREWKRLHPPSLTVAKLICTDEFWQTPETVEFYKSLKPLNSEIEWLVEECVFCQSAEIRAILEA